MKLVNGEKAWEWFNWQEFLSESQETVLVHTIKVVLRFKEMLYGLYKASESSTRHLRGEGTVITGLVRNPLSIKRWVCAGQTGIEGIGGMD